MHYPEVESTFFDGVQIDTLRPKYRKQEPYNTYSEAVVHVAVSVQVS